MDITCRIPSTSMSNAVEVQWAMRCQTEIDTICHLARSANVVLFTPVVTPLVSATGHVTDAFEPLGRCLSNHHSRIRHVPYVSATSDGFTATHAMFVRQAAVVVVVVCILDDGYSKNLSGVARHQAKFAEDLAEWARSWSIKVPMVLVKIGRRAVGEDVRGHVNELLCRTYSISNLEMIANALFQL